MRSKLIPIFLLAAMLLSVVGGIQPAQAASPGDIVINEIMKDPSAVYDSDGEWFELYNPTAGDIDIDGWTILDNDYDLHVISNGDPLLVPAGGFLVLGRNADSATNGGVDVAYQYSGFYLGNDGDEVVLLDGTTEIDRVEYDGGPSFPNPTGASMSLLDPYLDNNLGENWCTSTTPFGDGDLGTPGDINTCVPTGGVPLTIMEIQGSGRYSDYDGQKVDTTGVVTLFTANGSNCWIQDPYGDGDPGTSDGIFVSGCAYADVGPVPAVGDLIRIIARVDEQQYGNSLPLTRLTSVQYIEVLSSGNPSPAAVNLSDLPDESMTEGEAFWESLEGMLVSVENAPVVAPTNGYGEFGMLTKDDAKPGSGFYPETEQILIRELSQDPNTVDYNPERVFVDDSSLDSPIIVMPGDRMRSFVGVVDYTFSMYKMQPVSYDVFNHNLPNLPASTRSGGFGNTAITTFNVENLFDLELNTPTILDSFGQVGYDPGSSWGPPPTANNTLLRKPDVCQGDVDPYDAFDPSLEWNGTGNNNFSDLGTHTSDCSLMNGLIISEYVEGSGLNKALEIYNGTGSPIDLGALTVQIFFNGNTYAGQTIPLSGMLADGDVFVLANPSADSAILAVADQTSGGVLFNGDDAVTLNIGGKDDASSTPSPEELETQLTKLALAIQVELQLPEIIVVQEIENQAIAQELADRVNAATGTSYVATSFETSDGRGIEPGFLWDASRVSLLDAYQMSGPDVDEWFGPTSPSPGREPIVGLFEIEGRQVTIIGNHFKSKSGDDPLYGVNWPPYRVTEVQRKGQARVVRDFVNGILDADPGALVIVAGDLNDFQFGEPGEDDIGDEPGHPLSILEGNAGEVPLTNLLYFEKPAEIFSYVFDGNSQELDHMLVSPALLDMVVGADILHFNASYPASLGDDASTPLSSSDHDPLEGRFKIK